MTVELEAGASQLQCSMRPISAHLILASGWLRAGIHGAVASERIRGCPLSTGFSKVLHGRSGGARLGE